MSAVIALVGRPNVGKSTLFNKLTRSRDALVADHAGLTRDRLYGQVSQQGKAFALIDTGGLTAVSDNMSNLMRQQTEMAIEDATAILFLVDGQTGLTTEDIEVATQLRQANKPVVLVVNKSEGVEHEMMAAEFYTLGLGEPITISATQNRGLKQLLAVLSQKCPDINQSEITGEEEEAQRHIKLAIMGRPNVGKSTLINRLMGETRVVALDEPGTTRDSIYIPFEKNGQAYTLIDTAGVRRKSRVSEKLEKFSVIKTLKALEDANVILLMIDGKTGVVEQDLHLAGLIIESGRAVVLAINKWDGLDKSEREWVVNNIERRLPFMSYAKKHYISALHGSGVGLLLNSVDIAYRSAMAQPATSQLTRILEDAVAEHAPPLVKGRRIKFRYAHLGGRNPPRIIIHGNQTDATPKSYQRYLENTYRAVLKLHGTPIKVEFKMTINPYQNKAR